MSLAATTYVLAQKFGSQSRKLLMLAIADGADDQGKNSWQAVDTLAHKAECSARTVQRLTQELERTGHISVRWGAGPRGTNIIRINFQKLPDGFHHPWEGCHHVAPAVQKPTSPRRGNCSETHVTTSGGGDNGGPPLSPEQGGTVPLPPGGGERSPTPPTSSANDPGVTAEIWEHLRACFPDAPPALSATESTHLKSVLPHLRDHTPDDWTAILAWNTATDRVRGRKLWPRDRGEFLREYFEAIQKIRPWWRKTGKRWWDGRTPTSSPALAEALPPAADVLTPQEALALLRAPL